MNGGPKKPKNAFEKKQDTMNRRAFLGTLGVAGAFTAAQVAGLRPKTDAEIRKEEQKKKEETAPSVAENKALDTEEDKKENQ